MYLTSVHPCFGHGWWDDYADGYEQGLKNKQNKICVYEGVFRCAALVTTRGRVLASTGISVQEMQFLITNGYIFSKSSCQ